MRWLLPLAAGVVLTSCVAPEDLSDRSNLTDPEGGRVGMPSPYPQAGQLSPVAGFPAADSEDYHTGFDIGARDRSYGYPGDSRRAFQHFGHEHEAAFREGYNDGYSGRAPQH